jgi:NADH-quinone oxidoreductase subunit E
MKNKAPYTIPDSELDSIIEQQRGKPGMLLSILEEVQELHPQKYLPYDTLITLAQKLKLPYSQVYSVVTFYSFFNLMPQGRHSIVVCRGTACHTKGSKALLAEIAPLLGIKKEEYTSESNYTTPDNEFTIKTVACFGQCALSPVIAIDGIIHSSVCSQKLMQIINKLKAKAKSESNK